VGGGGPSKTRGRKEKNVGRLHETAKVGRKRIENDETAGMRQRGGGGSQRSIKTKKVREGFRLLRGPRSGRA